MPFTFIVLMSLAPSYLQLAGHCLLVCGVITLDCGSEYVLIYLWVYYVVVSQTSPHVTLCQCDSVVDIFQFQLSYQSKFLVSVFQFFQFRYRYR